MLQKNKSMKRGVFRIPTKNKHTLTETLHTTLSIQEWKQSMIQFHNLEKLQECRQLMIQKITFNMTWINDMGNGNINADYDQRRDQSIIKYPKNSGRGNLSLLMWPQKRPNKTKRIRALTCMPTHAGITHGYV